MVRALFSLFLFLGFRLWIKRSATIPARRDFCVRVVHSYRELPYVLTDIVIRGKPFSSLRVPLTPPAGGRGNGRQDLWRDRAGSTDRRNRGAEEKELRGNRFWHLRNDFYHFEAESWHRDNRRGPHHVREIAGLTPQKNETAGRVPPLELPAAGLERTRF